MSGHENTSAPVSTRPRAWDFMETVFVALIAYATYHLALWIVILVLWSMPDGLKWSLDQLGLESVADIVATPLVAAVLWIATQMARRDFAEYLALNWPSLEELMRALAITAIILLTEILARYAVGAPHASLPYANADQTGGLLIFLIGACIAAPVTEEFVFRGFIFRGWSESFLGPVGCILLTSAVWAMLHVQHEWFGRFFIFVSGLALGYFRWRSNSTWLPITVHSAMNVFVAVAAGLRI